MDVKKYLIAVIVVFVVYSAAAYLTHNVLLAPDYAAMSATLRSESAFLQRMPVLYLANLIFALGFCVIYTRGYEPGKNWLGQGFRYGLFVGTLLAPVALAAYVAFPLPGSVAVKWIGLGYVQVVIAGLTAASIYRHPPPPKTL
jgi:hypothetical protein